MLGHYVLLTAAKDEEADISEVVELVLRQTIRPIAWIIVDDGSTDRTAEIVRAFAKDHPFIILLSSGINGNRNFGSQYKAVQFAYQYAQSMDFEFVAVQDADQAPAHEDYYAVILNLFHVNRSLGMASGMVYERGPGGWEYRASNSQDSTAGSVVFRRKCFDAIGGYVPLSFGGSDWLAQLEARRAGWQTLATPSLRLLHYRPSSSAGGIWRGRFREGMMDASFGSLCTFEFLKCLRRLRLKPALVGGLVRFVGYLWWKVTRGGPVLSPEQVRFVRSEQRARLSAVLLKRASALTPYR